MRTIWNFVGRVIFWVSWPLLGRYLQATTRVRCVVIADQALLLTKTWIGDGKWSLPGGGVKPGESLVHAVIREVHEETGLVIAQSDIISSPVEIIFSKYGQGLREFCFTVRLPAQLPIHAQFLEIAACAWIDRHQLAGTSAGPDVHAGLLVWPV